MLDSGEAALSLPLARPARATTWDRLTSLRLVAPIAALVVLALLVLVPLATMLLASLRPAGTFPLDAGPLVLSNFSSVYLEANTLAMLRNTALYALVPIVLALPLAFALAFLTERTDLPLRELVFAAMFVPMSVPVFASAMSWFLLLGPRAGTLNVWLRTALGLDIREGPFNILTLQGMIFVHALGIIPSMWLILISVLRAMDPGLEEAAAAAGGGRWGTLRRVTIPLMAPGILGVVILFAVAGIDSLETPLALGTPAGVEVMATRVYDLLHQPTGVGFAFGPPAALGALGLLVGVLGIGLYTLLTGRASRYVVVTGKAYRPRLVPLGGWKYLALACVGAY